MKMANNHNLDAFRLAVRHYFWWLVLATFVLNAAVALAVGKEKGAALSNVLVPALGAAWFYSSSYAVHGVPFKSKPKTAIVFDIFTLACCASGVFGFVEALDTLFS